MTTVNLLKLVLIFACLLLFGSPIHLKAQHGYVDPDDIIQELNLSSKGKLPKAFKLGTDKDKLEEKVTELDIYVNEKDYIVYTLYFREDKMDFGDITYDFEKGVLTSASFETYFTHQKECDEVIDQIMETFNKKYKTPRLNGKNFIWTYLGSAKKQGFEIELTNVSTSSDYGFTIDYYTEGLLPKTN